MVRISRTRRDQRTSEERNDTSTGAENSIDLKENKSAEGTPTLQNKTIQQEGIDTTTEREINTQRNTNVEFEDHQTPVVTKVRKNIRSHITEQNNISTITQNVQQNTTECRIKHTKIKQLR